MIPSKPYTKLLLILTIGLIIPVIDVLLVNSVPHTHTWTSENVHSSIETIGAVGSIVIALFIMMLLRQRKINALYIWVSSAFFSMGILDLYHALVPAGQTFVWLHSIATLVGGCLFVFVWLPDKFSRSPKTGIFLIFLSVVVAAFGALSIVKSEWIPVMVSQGRFTSTAILINTAGGVFFLVASLRFIKRYLLNMEQWDSFLFAVLCLLFGFAGILFAFSDLWNGDWWWWHFLRLLAYLISIAYLFLRYQQTNKQLRKEISEREKVMRDLTNEKSFVEMLINIAPIIILVLDADGRIVRYNSHLEELSGHSLEKMKGRDWFSSFLPVEDHDEIRELFKKAINQIKIKGNINPIVSKDGRIIPIEWHNNTLRDLTGNTIGVLAIGFDITEKQQAKEKDRQQNEFLNNVINSLSHPFYVVNIDDYTIELANRAASDEGISHQGEKCYFQHGNRKPCLEENCPLEQIKKTKQPCVAEHVHLNGNGELRNLEIHAYPIFDAEGEVEKVIEYSLDVTEQKKMNLRLENAKEQAEAANIAKSEFLANMSHELRTPLNAIIGFSQILEKNHFGTLNEKQKKYLYHIKEGGDHLLNMVNDILDLSKIEAGKLEFDFKPFDFETMLDRSPLAIQSQANAKGLIVEIDIQNNLGWLNGDESRLKQVIFNLLSNAVKFTPQGKRLGLKATAKNERVRVVVWDEGIGIEENNLEQIFMPFEQVKNSLSASAKGTGLGLAISKRIVNMHGGIISASSVPGQGSQFILELTGRIVIHGNTMDEQTRKTDQINMVIDSTKKILLVEDNPRNTELVQSALQPFGFQLTCVETGEEAIQVFSEGRFDLVLMDIQLPGMDGIRTMHKIRETHRATTPFIALTASAMKGDEERLISEGFDEYLSKPMDLDALEEKVRIHLNRQIYQH